MPESSTGERLQKVLAAAGVGSRRHCEELIEAGRVVVDGVVAERQGMRVDPATAILHVDGSRVVTNVDHVSLAFHKPAGVVSTMSDDRGRLSIGDVVADRSARLYHVGRLDAATEGLLLLTNNGELAHRLMHPSYLVPKTYLAEVTGPIGRAARQQLRAGVLLDDGPVRADAINVVGNVPGRALVEITVHEGRKHVVRRMFAAVDHPVHRLVRTAVGPIQLGSLKSGRTRRLNRQELSALHALVDL